MNETDRIGKQSVIEAVYRYLQRFEGDQVDLSVVLTSWGDVLPRLKGLVEPQGEGGDESPTVLTHPAELVNPPSEEGESGPRTLPSGSRPRSKSPRGDSGASMVPPHSGSMIGGPPAEPRPAPAALVPAKVVGIDPEIMANGDISGVDDNSDVTMDLSSLVKRPPTGMDRYDLGEEIARGGQGVIISAQDKVIGRPVAFKLLHQEMRSNKDLVSRFLEEAQVTGQLEHPHIVPVHDMGWQADGSPFYTMKRIEGQTLRKVIVASRKGVTEVIEQFSRVRLLGILQKVCQAVAYAHARGVIHRDLKPANIMVGAYGEVLVLDWGVAKVKGEKDRNLEALQPVMTERRRRGSSTLVGTVEGTPSYMSPEQARGEVHSIDERSDVYALGAILYEILTYRPPFRGKDWRKVLESVVRDEPIPPRVLAPERSISAELEAICLKCLSKKPEDRYPSAEALEKDLEAFLEGTRRRAAAAQRVAQARELTSRYKALRNELMMARLVARRAGKGIEGWEPVERKRGVWVTEAQVVEKEAKLAVSFGESAARFGQALAHDPDNNEAREGLADLYRLGLEEAEAEGNRPQMVYCEEMVRQYHDGKYAAFLKGDGQVTFVSNPPGAEVWITSFEEQDRVLKAVSPRKLGIAPLEKVRLPRGSYLVLMKKPGFRDVRYPLFVGRLAEMTVRISLFTEEEVGDGFILIPGGTYRRAGDPEAVDPLTTEEVQVHTFAITRFPITFRQYCGFLDALAGRDPQAMDEYLPWLEERGVLVQQGLDGHFAPVEGLISPEVRDQLYGPGAEWDLPVVGVDFEAAEAFCAWAASQTGRPIRLPTEDEWEKAARGTDRRPFPWGHWFDPVFCKSRLSRPYASELEPVGSFETDTSPYGVQDMAGLIREWCDGWYSELEELRVLRGGAWCDTERSHRVSSRGFYDPQSGRRLHGFRCACSMTDREVSG